MLGLYTPCDFGKPRPAYCRNVYLFERAGYLENVNVSVGRLVILLVKEFLHVLMLYIWKRTKALYQSGPAAAGGAGGGGGGGEGIQLQTLG